MFYWLCFIDNFIRVIFNCVREFGIYVCLEIGFDIWIIDFFIICGIIIIIIWLVLFRDWI